MIAHDPIEMGLKLPEGYSIRAAVMEDVEEVADLINAYYQNLIGEDDTNPESLRHEWETPDFTLERNTRLVIAPNGKIAGYAQVMDVNKPLVRIFCWAVSHPAYQELGLDAQMLRWVIATACDSMQTRSPEGARVVVVTQAWPQDKTGIHALEAAEFNKVRTFYEMHIEMDSPPPAPVWSEGITLRAFDPVRDVREVALGIQEGFRDHWGFVERPIEQRIEQMQHKFEEKDFDPALWFVAMDGDQIAGLSLCQPNTPYDDKLGWVDQLTVLRPWRKQGLALALLHHTFGEFYRRGITRVGLGVDASSLTGATRLYERAGMSVVHQFSAYELELREGVELMTQELE
jgi:mycothiol synthase